MTKETTKTYDCPKCGGTLTEITREFFSNEQTTPIKTTVEVNCPDCSGCQLCKIGAQHNECPTPR